MDPSPRLLPWDEIDRDAYCRLQQSAFAEIFAKNGVPIERLNRAFLEWKYAPPAGRARVAVVMHGDEMVASNAMFPLRVVHGDEQASAWQSCDTATSPAARGKGYFKKCITTLRDSLSAGETFFGYPNENSKKGFEGIGWNVAAEVPFRARPIWWGAKVGPEIATVQTFDARQDDLAKHLAVGADAMIERSAAYLNWRYVRHPFFAYERYQCVHDGRVTGLLVLNQAVVRGKRVMVVMEFLAIDVRWARSMAARALRSARDGDCSMMIAIGNRPVPGLWRVPKALAPKQQLLMGQKIGPPHGALTEPWLVQAGDWDVF
ncbi:MAG: GNAT family N-acetyltransferase [Planctomycetota bacterium]|nr:GNAT family N-acetyltransferase [Planctomycetota bacterium]